MKEKYSIGVFSERTGTPVRTLHYYDEIGLLKPEKNASSGHRQYSEKDVLTLQKIISFKFLGYSLEQICTMLHESKHDVGLMETLLVQRKAFEEKKEHIESSLRAIQRTITLLEDQGEVDSTVLMSLIRNIQTEKEQKQWLEKRISKEVVSQLFDKSEEDLVELDKQFISFMKGMRELSTEPFDSPEVQRFVGTFIETLMSSLGGIEAIQALAELDHKEIDELDRLVPSPFTNEDDEWLQQAIAYYSDNHEELKEMLGDGKDEK
ncbi:MerR family transcriptional regulator [Bacillus horti]|uniref:DNA-binding transcriptional MerR regulator n=1 Tax=Caldalkalibacillus horti TaxID=77523 RepID=A0ABT9W6K2_9BACI|nr:MerR family transcriptional regulator [Bacillus horti]MDQ0168480.1 DNA-binding transcriptional MerR regulator [Bacillus horti]